MKFIVVTELNQVAYVKLHRPEVRNAFNPEMISEMTELFRHFNQRKDLRAIVLQGEGKAFCAGGDLNWMKEMVNFSEDQNLEDSKKIFEMFESLYKCELPVIAVVHGAVFGGGLGLIAACDEVIAEEGTQFCFSEVKLGIAPAVISAFVTRKGVLGKLRPLMLSAAVFDVRKAYDAGLVTEIVDAGQGHSALQRALHNYALCGPEAVRETKKLLNSLGSLDWNEQKKYTANLIAGRRASEEGQEGLKAFLEKREPSWRGK